MTLNDTDDADDNSFFLSCGQRSSLLLDLSAEIV